MMCWEIFRNFYNVYKLEQRKIKEINFANLFEWIKFFSEKLEKKRK